MRKTNLDTNMYGKQNASKMAGIVSTSSGKPSRPRHQTGKMNATEQRYAAEVLALAVENSDLQYYMFEKLKFRLGKSCYYTPDFVALSTDGQLEVHEIKGHMEDDAAVKLRVFREIYPQIRLIIVRRLNNQWTYEERY